MKPLAISSLVLAAALAAGTASAQAPAAKAPAAPLPAAQPPAAQAAPAKPPTEVEGVEVIRPKDPKVVATFPTQGATIKGGTVVLKIVFDQRMTPEGWSYGHSDAGAFPDCLAKPRLLADQRTFVLLCSLAPSQSFALGVNVDPGFISAAGAGAQPFLLKFSTAADRNSALHDALTQAGLTDADEPIMEWNGGAAAPKSAITASTAP